MAGCVALDLIGKGLGAGAQFIGGQFVGPGGRSVDQVGDSDAARQQLTLAVGGEERRGQARFVDRAPEPITRPGEVVAGGARVKARVDAHEKDLEARCDQVLDGFIARSF